MKKILALTISFSFAIFLFGCAQTPNSVSLTVAQQGSCVTGAFPSYESSLFPINKNLPANSPYCVAIKLTNNNSGTNANNIQVNANGLQISYSVGGTSYSGSLIDFTAAGVAQSNFSSTTQQSFGNVVLFDPKNCVTTQGSQVQTIGTNGGNCTFYLQLSQEANPVGVYPITLTLNYTNGNSNYSVSTTLNQRVNLYVGTSGITPTNTWLTNASSNSNVLASSNSPDTNPIISITRDFFGNVYTGDNQGAIYQYNGTSASSWTKIVNAGPGGSIVAMASDTNTGYVYYVNQSGQVFQFNGANPPTSSTTLTPIATLSFSPSGLPVSMAVISSTTLGNNTIGIANGNNIYNFSCTNAVPSSCSAAGTSVNPSLQTINQIAAAGTSNFYSAESDGTFSVVGNLFSQFPASGYLNFANSLAYFITPGTTNAYVYAGGVMTSQSPNSMVFFESNGAAFAPLNSPSGGNPLLGTAQQIVVDQGQDVFVGGTNLTSADFTGTTASLAYLTSPSFAVGASDWTAITGFSTGGFLSMQTASQLTPY